VTTLREIALVQASVPATASFGEAATALSESGLAAIAVLDGERVVGLFTDLDVLRGTFPAYLGDLRHTAFLSVDVETLSARAREVSSLPVTKFMREPHLLELDTSSTHAAERFLHCEEGAFPVVDHDRFVGMLPRAEFALAMIRRLVGAD
jgi:CBS domain-containing protein